MNNELVAHNVSKETPLYFALPKGFLGKKASTRISCLAILMKTLFGRTNNKTFIDISKGKIRVPSTGRGLVEAGGRSKHQ